MKKGFIKYSLLWLVALGIFNAVAFLMPNELNSTFWIGYGAVTGAFVLQLLSTAWFFNKDLLQKRLGQIPVPVFCMMGLIALLAGSVAFAVTGMTLIVISSYVVVGVQYIANIVVIVTSGKGGEILLQRAKEVLVCEFPELNEKVTLNIPDEKARRVGQSVAAASLLPFSQVKMYCRPL